MSAASIAEPVILRAEHLGRTVNERSWLQDANFELQKGEVLGHRRSQRFGQDFAAAIAQPSR